MSLLNRYLQPFVDISENEPFFVFFWIFSYFFAQIRHMQTLIVFFLPDR